MTVEHEDGDSLRSLAAVLPKLADAAIAIGQAGLIPLDELKQLTELLELGAEVVGMATRPSIVEGKHLCRICDCELGSLPQVFQHHNGCPAVLFMLVEESYRDVRRSQRPPDFVTRIIPSRFDRAQ